MKKIIFLTLFFFTTLADANAQFSVLMSFQGPTNGSYPQGDLISDGTFLYGMTYMGGVNDLGTIFKIKPDGSAYAKLLDFSGTANGSQPLGSLIYDGTSLYGLTSRGGANDDGLIFKINPNGTGFSDLYDFSGSADGSVPYGSLISDGTFLYGMTYYGGVNNFGTIFKIQPNGTGFLKLFDFDGTTSGKWPNGNLFSDGTFLYGMTTLGGANNLGTIFKILPNGNNFSVLLDFDGPTTGASPYGSLISDGTFLYGMTRNGGTNDQGVIFKIMPNGTSYTKLLDFSGAVNGIYPWGSLLYDGTFLYGMATGGGANLYGSLFKIKTDGTTFTDLHDFQGGANGSVPYGSLISDGAYLYGMANQNGVYAQGIVFKLDIATGISENNPENIFSLYPNPSSGKITLNSKINEGEISICNLLGEIIFQSTINNQTIDLSSQSNGIYFVTVKTEKQSYTEKIVIEK